MPQEAAAVDVLPLDVKKLAKEATSKKGSIILAHLQEQVENQKKVMFGVSLKELSAEEIGNHTLASMELIRLLESVIAECELAVKAVKDARTLS